jgi:CRP/FNR family transcriptional regulator, cyclic AMP receptor protein
MTLALKLFLTDQPWMQLLSENEQLRVIADAYERSYPTGVFVCQTGDPAEQWIGVMKGLVKACVMTSEGKSTTYAGIGPGGWLGEGSVLNGTSRRFDVITLRDSTIVCIPRFTFMHLYNTNIKFCHYLINQLNRRLAQQMSLIQIDRLLDPETRVAKFLVMLAEAHVVRQSDYVLEINQTELANLCGLSRQFVNRALSKLHALQIIDHRYGSLRLLDMDRLRSFDGTSK